MDSQLLDGGFGTRRRARAAGRALFALDAGRLALQLTQVIQPTLPNLTTGDDLDPIDARRMQREGALDAHAVGNLAHGKGGAGAAALARNHHAFVNLDALLVAFLDDRVHANGVADPEAVERLLACILGFDVLDCGYDVTHSTPRLSPNSRSSMMAAAERTDKWL